MRSTHPDGITPCARRCGRWTVPPRDARSASWERGPDYAAGSVHAVTENGQVLIASNTGSQLGPYVSGAGKVIWVVGAQKLVKDLEEGMRRIEEHIVPLEEVHMQQLYNTHTNPSKVLIVNREIKPGPHHDDHCQGRAWFLVNKAF